MSIHRRSPRTVTAIGSMPPGHSAFRSPGTLRSRCLDHKQLGQWLRWDVPGASRETSTPQWPQRKERGNDKSETFLSWTSKAGQTFRLLSSHSANAVGLVRPTAINRWMLRAIRQPYLHFLQHGDHERGRVARGQRGSLQVMEQLGVLVDLSGVLYPQHSGGVAHAHNLWIGWICVRHDDERQVHGGVGTAGVRDELEEHSRLRARLHQVLDLLAHDFPAADLPSQRGLIEYCPHFGRGDAGLPLPFHEQLDRPVGAGLRTSHSAGSYYCAGIVLGLQQGRDADDTVLPELAGHSFHAKVGRPVRLNAVAVVVPPALLARIASQLDQAFALLIGCVVNREQVAYIPR